jgi:hypothetical protein
LHPLGRRYWQPQPPGVVAALPQQADFSLPSQHVVCFSALQQPALRAAGIT